MVVEISWSLLEMRNKNTYGRFMWAEFSVKVQLAVLLYIVRTTSLMNEWQLHRALSHIHTTWLLLNWHLSLAGRFGCIVDNVLVSMAESGCQIIDIIECGRKTNKAEIKAV